MDSHCSAKVSPVVYTELKESVIKNGHQPKVVPFTCISQKSTTKETFTIASFMYLLQKESKIKAHLLLFIFMGESEWSGGDDNYRLDKYASRQQETWKKEHCVL